MAVVTYDAATTFGDTTAGTSTSVSHTAGNQATAAFCVGEYGGQSISSITYGGVNLSWGIEYTSNRSYVYYLTNPPKGTNTMVVTSGFSDTSRHIAMTLNGTDTTPSIIGASATATVVGTSLNTSLFTTRPGSINIDCLVNGGDADTSGQATTGANQTSRGVDDPATGLLPVASTSTQPAERIGSYTLGWSWTGSDNSRYTICEIRAELSKQVSY